MTQQQQASITTRAMLVSLSISYWTGKAGDDRMEDDIIKSRKVERSMIESKKMLIQAEALNAVKAARSRARAYHFQKTSPWIDGGTRVLPAAFYKEYSEKMREFRSEYESEVATLCKNYPQLKGEARKRLSSLYKEEDYPGVDMLRSKFDWGLNVYPIPEKGDWRVDLGDKASVEIKKRIEEQTKAACALVTRDCFQRLYKVVAHLAAQLKDADSVFRDSVIVNIRELLKILPQMNLADDAKLNSMIAEINKTLCGYAPDDLREDMKKRKKAVSEADDILAKMAGYIGGK